MIDAKTITPRKGDTPHVTGDQARARGLAQESAAAKTPEQDHHQRYHRGLRHQPHDVLLSLQGHLRPCRVVVPGGCEPRARWQQDLRDIV